MPAKTRAKRTATASRTVSPKKVSIKRPVKKASFKKSAVATRMVNRIGKATIQRRGATPLALTGSGSEHLLLEALPKKQTVRAVIINKRGDRFVRGKALTIKVRQVPVIIRGLGAYFDVYPNEPNSGGISRGSIEMMNRVVELIQEHYERISNSVIMRPPRNDRQIDMVMQKIEAMQAKIAALIQEQANQVGGKVLQWFFGALQGFNENGDWRVKDDDGDGIINLRDDDYTGPKDKTHDAFENPLTIFGNGPIMPKTITRWNRQGISPTIVYFAQPSARTRRMKNVHQYRF